MSTDRDRARWVVIHWGSDGLPNYLSGHRFRFAAEAAARSQYDVVSRADFDAAWANWTAETR